MKLDMKLETVNALEHEVQALQIARLIKDINGINGIKGRRANKGSKASKDSRGTRGIVKGTVNADSAQGADDARSLAALLAKIGRRAHCPDSKTRVEACLVLNVQDLKDFDLLKYGNTGDSGYPAARSWCLDKKGNFRIEAERMPVLQARDALGTPGALRLRYLVSKRSVHTVVGLSWSACHFGGWREMYPRNWSNG